MRPCRKLFVNTFRDPPDVLIIPAPFRAARVKKPVTGGAKAKLFFGLYWRSIVVVLAPTLFSLIMFTNEDESQVKAYRCLYVVCVVSSQLRADL
jgi:hypothetical protein